MKIKNEKLLKKNIQERLDELNTCLSKLENVQNKIKKCRENISIADSELAILYHNRHYKIFSIEDAGAALESADSKTSRKKELMEIISINQERVESLMDAESNLYVKSMGLKEPVKLAREAYCRAYEEAVKTTPEWKMVQENIGAIKALWFETLSGNIYVEDVILELGLHEQPVEYFKEKARAELFIK